MKFDRNNEFDFCYWQVNSLRIKSSVASKWASKQLWANIYLAVHAKVNCILRDFSKKCHRLEYIVQTIVPEIVKFVQIKV